MAQGFSALEIVTCRSNAAAATDTVSTSFMIPDSVVIFLYQIENCATSANKKSKLILSASNGRVFIPMVWDNHLFARTNITVAIIQ